MNLYDYQKWTETTAIYPKDKAFDYLIPGLTAEVGELMDHFAKKVRDGKWDESAVVKEIGDIYWFLARIADELGYDSQLILENNVDKLTDRKNRGVISGSGDSR